MTPQAKDDMVVAMRRIMSGDMTDSDIESFLMDLSARGETVDELTGAAQVMREKCIPITAPPDTVDCCGTGGDGQHTLNISTAVALVSAACGVPVAKHGNRSASSKSGAADVLEQLGVHLTLSPQHLSESLTWFHFCFLMAPVHHPSMKYVANVRKKIGKRTLFNLLGPLANPAGASRQLMGVYDDAWRRPMAETLKNLGTVCAWVVHGTDGLDEITTTGDTHVSILRGGDITEAILSPEQVGLNYADPQDLKGGTAAENAQALRELLQGRLSAYRDIVRLNVAAVLNIHGTCPDLREGVERAAHAIDSGRAHQILNDYILFSQEHA
ncbi:MAG: anthranilate phosphoribosyltransferase [Alphaproteobacteria bacterium]|nr:anthranilate phosphoribosyltransferase [Alphaproteobacteria bacterium]